MTNSYALGSTSNLDTTTWITLTLPPGSPDAATSRTEMTAQIARFQCICATSGGVGTLGVALVDPSASGNGIGTADVVVALYKATITASSDRAGSALASGSYLCTTAFADNTDKLDLLGYGAAINNYNSSGTATGNNSAKLVWKVGLYNVATSTGAVMCRVSDTRAI